MHRKNVPSKPALISASQNDDDEIETELQDTRAKKRSIKGQSRRDTKKARPSRADSEVQEASEETKQEWKSFIANPPPTICFASAKPAPLPPYWGTKRGAKDAADCRESMDVARLVGSATLTFDVRHSEDPRSLLRRLSAQVEETRQVLRKDERDPQVVTWNDDGEPGSGDCLTVMRILEACDDGELIPRDSQPRGGAHRHSTSGGGDGGSPSPSPLSHLFTSIFLLMYPGY